jgi:hypothetical protein
MPDILYPPSRPLSAGEILDLAFRIFRASVLACLPYAAVAVIAGQLPTLYNVAIGRPLLTPVEQVRDPVWWLLYVLAALIPMILATAVLLRQYAIATGSVPAAGKELGTGLRRLPGLLLLLVLLVLATLVCFLPAVFFRGPSAVMVLVLLCIPVTYVWVALSCSWTVLMLTGTGAVASAQQSWRLTSGSFWRLTLIYSVAVVLLVVLYVLSGVIAVALAVPLARGDLAVITAVTTVVVVILGALGMPFYAALGLAVYGDLSVRREGTDLAGRIAAAAPR